MQLRGHLLGPSRVRWPVRPAARTRGPHGGRPHGRHRHRSGAAVPPRRRRCGSPSGRRDSWRSSRSTMTSTACSVTWSASRDRGTSYPAPAGASAISGERAVVSPPGAFVAIYRLLLRSLATRGRLIGLGLLGVVGVIVGLPSVRPTRSTRSTRARTSSTASACRCWYRSPRSSSRQRRRRCDRRRHTRLPLAAAGAPVPIGHSPPSPPRSRSASR